MIERKGEKIGWIGGWFGGFIWLALLSIIWLWLYMDSRLVTIFAVL